MLKVLKYAALLMGSLAIIFGMIMLIPTPAGGGSTVKSTEPNNSIGSETKASTNTAQVQDTQRSTGSKLSLPKSSMTPAAPSSDYHPPQEQPGAVTSSGWSTPPPVAAPVYSPPSGPSCMELYNTQQAALAPLQTQLTDISNQQYHLTDTINARAAGTDMNQAQRDQLEASERQKLDNEYSQIKAQYDAKAAQYRTC